MPLLKVRYEGVFALISINVNISYENILQFALVCLHFWLHEFKGAFDIFRCYLSMNRLSVYFQILLEKILKKCSQRRYFSAKFIYSTKLDGKVFTAVPMRKLCVDLFKNLLFLNAWHDSIIVISPEPLSGLQLGACIACSQSCSNFREPVVLWSFIPEYPLIYIYF